MFAVGHFFQTKCH